MDIIFSIILSWFTNKKRPEQVPKKRKFFPRIVLMVGLVCLAGCQTPYISPGDRVHQFIRECRADLDSRIVASTEYEYRVEANDNWGRCIAAAGGGSDGGPSNYDLAIQNGLILGNQLAPPVPPGRQWR